MTRVSDKDAYVRRQTGDGRHRCHWPGCSRVVPPAMWGCRAHWFKLPKPIRDAIWRAYEPGQEITKAPSAAYREAARTAQDWIAAQDRKGSLL